MTDRHPRERERSGDFRQLSLLGKAGWIWRNGIPLLALGLAALAVTGTQSDVDRQREGREVAVDVLCGGLSGVADAGKRTLEGRLPGLPGPGVPRASEAYARIISLSVIKQAGVEARDVLNRDGTINCERLKVAAKTSAP